MQKQYGKRTQTVKLSTERKKEDTNDIFTTITTSPESYILRPSASLNRSTQSLSRTNSTGTTSSTNNSSSNRIPPKGTSSFSLLLAPSVPLSSSSSSVAVTSSSSNGQQSNNYKATVPKVVSVVRSDTSESLLRRPLKGLLGRLRIREEGRGTLQGGNYTTSNGSSSSNVSSIVEKLYTTVPNRHRITVQSLLQRIPLLQECILLGFSKDGAYLYSYSFDTDIRLQLQVWRYNGMKGLSYTHPSTSNTSTVFATMNNAPVRTVEDYVKLVKNPLPIQLHATVPLFPHIDFTMYSSIGSLLDGTYIRITLWEAPDQGCLIVIGNLSEKFLSLGSHPPYSGNNNSINNLSSDSSSSSNPSSVKNNNKPVGQMYHITIIPAIPSSIPSLSVSSSSDNAFARNAPGLDPNSSISPTFTPWISTDSSFLSSTTHTNTINAFHFSYPVAPPYPRPSIIGFECIRSGIGETEHTALGEHELHTVSTNIRNNSNDSNTHPLSKSSSVNLCITAQKYLRSLQLTHMYRLLLNSGDSLRCFTFGVRKVGILLSNSEVLSSESTTTDSSTFTPSPWYTMSSVCSFASMRDRVPLHNNDSLSVPSLISSIFSCTCSENCMLNTKLRSLSSSSSSTTVSSARIPHLSNARYTVCDRNFAEKYVRTNSGFFRDHYSSFHSSNDTESTVENSISPSVDTVHPSYSHGLWNVEQGMEIIRNSDDVRSYMGAVCILSQAIVDIGTLLQRCIRGRIQNYDSRLVRIMDTAENELLLPKSSNKNEIDEGNKVKDKDNQDDDVPFPESNNTMEKKKRLRDTIPATDSVFTYPDLSVTEGGKVRDARYALLCCLVDHVLPLVGAMNNSDAGSVPVNLTSVVTAKDKVWENETIESRGNTSVLEVMSGDKELIISPLNSDNTLMDQRVPSPSSNYGPGIGVKSSSSASASSSSSTTGTTIMTGTSNVSSWRSNNVYGRTNSSSVPTTTDEFWDTIDKENKHSLLSSTSLTALNSFPKDSPELSSSSSSSTSSTGSSNNNIWLMKLTPSSFSSSPASTVSPLPIIDQPGSTRSSSSSNNLLHNLIKSDEIRNNKNAILTNENDLSTVSLSITSSSSSSSSGKSMEENPKDEEIEDSSKTNSTSASSSTDNDYDSDTNESTTSTDSGSNSISPRVRISEAPLIRSKVIYVIDLLSPTGSVRVLSVNRMPPQYQPAFDRSTGRSLTSLTSHITTSLRQQNYIPSHPLQYPRELNNDPVLTGKSLSHIINPELPIAIVI